MASKTERSFVGLSRLRQLPETEAMDLPQSTAVLDDRDLVATEKNIVRQQVQESDPQLEASAREVSLPFSPLKKDLKNNIKQALQTNNIHTPLPIPAARPFVSQSEAIQKQSQPDKLGMAFVQLPEAFEHVVPDASFEEVSSQYTSEEKLSAPLAQQAEAVIEAVMTVQAPINTESRDIQASAFEPTAFNATTDTTVVSTEARHQVLSPVSSQELYVLQHKLYEAMLHLTDLLANEKAPFNDIHARLEALRSILPMFKTLQESLK